MKDSPTKDGHADAGFRNAVTGAEAMREHADEIARVKQAAHAETPADILTSLAADPSVTVRAAVAMNTAAPPQADDLLARDRDDRVRELLARKLASRAPGAGQQDADRIRRHAAVTLTAMVEDEAVRVRAAIADVLKEMPAAPRETILRLARDASVEVSDPVIRLSPLLTSSDLLALVTAPPSPTTPATVARRPHLTEIVSDAIAASADTAAIRALLENKSAAIRESALDRLIADAADHTDWHEPLVNRPMLSGKAARALSQMVATQLLQQLVSRSDLDPSVSGELQRRLDARLSRPAAYGTTTRPTGPAASPAEGVDCAATEVTLLNALRQGDQRTAINLLAAAAGVTAAVVERAATLRSAKGLVSLIWKAGFTMRVAGPLQGQLTRLPPHAILAAGPTGDFPLSTEEMRWHLEFLGRSDHAAHGADPHHAGGH